MIYCARVKDSTNVHRAESIGQAAMGHDPGITTSYSRLRNASDRFFSPLPLTGTRKQA